MADYENNEGASPKKRLIIGLVVLVVVAALAIGPEGLCGAKGI